MSRRTVTTLGLLLAVAACTAPSADPAAAPTSSTEGPTTSAPARPPPVEVEQAAFEAALRDKLTLPPMPSFSIPTQLLESPANQDISGRLDVPPGLYQGIAVVDARCTDAGVAAPADSGAPVAGAGAAAHYDDGERDITVAGDGTGVYDAPGLHVAVLADGSGVFDDGQTRLSVTSDGAGTYASGDRRLTVRADGSGSYADSDSRLWVDATGAGGYQDDSVRVSLTSAGEVFGDGDPVKVDAVRAVLGEGLPLFPPVPAVAVVQPTGTVCGAVIRLDANVLFDYDRADIRPDGAVLLERVAALLAAIGFPRAEVNGHTDHLGDEAYNVDLSQRRADAVRDLLVGAGVPASSLTAQGLGESQPLRPETRADGSDDPAARQLDRRVELVLRDD